MKKLFLLSLLFCCKSAFGEEETLTYFNSGVSTWIPAWIPGRTISGERYGGGGSIPPHIITGPDLSWGKRGLSSHHVFDRSVGAAGTLLVQLLYVQGSYLYFPTPSKGIYGGIGLTVGFFPVLPAPYVNIPITLGYQFPRKGGPTDTGKERFGFIQLQVTPAFSGTISAGIGF